MFGTEYMSMQQVKQAFAYNIRCFEANGQASVFPNPKPKGIGNTCSVHLHPMNRTEFCEFRKSTDRNSNTMIKFGL